MKGFLELMARYNQTANGALYKILEGRDPALITCNAKSHFKSILGLLNHILVSDLNWLTAYRNGSLDLPVLDSPVLDFKHPGWGNILYDNLSDLWEHRQGVDSLLIRFVEVTSSELFEGDIDIKNPSGKVYKFPFGKILMHLFNHQTHHRGAIAQILDENAVENDYSNLLELLLN